MNTKTLRLENSLLIIIITTVLIWQPVALISIFLLLAFKIYRNKWNVFKTSFSLLIIILLIYIIIKLLYLDQLPENFKYLEKYMILFVTFSSLYNVSTHSKTKLISMYIVMIFVCQIFSFGHIIWYYHNNEIVFEGLSNFKFINEAIGFERPYIGFSSAIAILFLLFSSKNIPKWLNIIFILFGLFYIYFISAKLATGLTLIYLTAYLIKKKYWVFLFTSLLTLVLLIILIPNNKLTIIKRFKQLPNDERIYLWSNTLEIKMNVDFNNFTGNKKFGYKSLNKELQKLNIKNLNNPERRRFYKKTIRNTHNQFLETYVIFGIIGVILLLLPFINLILKSVQFSQYLSAGVTISFLLFMLIENVLERQVGILLMGVLLAITLFKPEE